MKLPGWLSWLPLGRVPSKAPQEVNQALDSFLLIDVRSSIEFSNSHIPGALSIPLHRLNKRTISRIPKDKHVVCICLSAHRSKPAVRKLRRAGLTSYELEGGMLKWWRLKLPTETNKSI